MMRYYLAVLALIGFVGCEKPAEQNNNANKPVAAPAEDHEEHHAHGPHDGHPFSVEGVPGKVEAIVDKNANKMQVFFLNADASADQAIKAEKVVVSTDKLGGKSFELKAVNPDANGMAVEYSLESKELVDIAGLSPKLEVTIDGKTGSGQMDFH
jgi:hypothetical protein